MSTKPAPTKTARKQAPAAATSVVKPVAKRVAAKRSSPKAKADSMPVVAQQAEATAQEPAAHPGGDAKSAPKAAPKIKLVRDSFTMPQADIDLLGAIKQRALSAGRLTKKSEVLRSGLHALQALSDKALIDLLNGLVPVKTGRPKKGTKS